MEKYFKKALLLLMLVLFVGLTSCDDPAVVGSDDPNYNQLFEQTEFTETVRPWILETDKGSEAKLMELKDGVVHIRVGDNDVKPSFEYGLQFSYPMLEIQKGKTYKLNFDVMIKNKENVSEKTPHKFNVAIAGDRANVPNQYSDVLGHGGDTLTVAENDEWVSY
ncbi:MAG TPA: carbohydrate binding domain-containing protein [Spirochaetota bacterium]|nr:carbohydrate binding domain-containing protein [Spirochaetota bacterium]